MEGILVLGIWVGGRRPTLSQLSRKQLAFRYCFTELAACLAVWTIHNDYDSGPGAVQAEGRVSRQS